MQKIKIVNVEGINYLVVDNEVFDWGVDNIEDINFKIKNDPLMKHNFIGSIVKNFTDCFSEFIGRKITLKEINHAIKKGEI